MSAVPLSRPSTLDRLAACVSRISVRHSSGRPRYRKPKPELTGFPEGHGEKIWIFSNVRSKQVAYSHFPVLDVYKAFQQIPFTAKKAKPAKIRKDLWRKIAMVQFPAGKGKIGQSAFQKLREFNQRHLLEWDDSMYYGRPEDSDEPEQCLTRMERGKKILEQRDNAVADLAAVLAGSGKSNKIRSAGADGQEGELCEATVYWANGIDRHLATEWSENVRHGLLPDGVDWSAEPGTVEPSKEYRLLPGEASAKAAVKGEPAKEEPAKVEA